MSPQLGWSPLDLAREDVRTAVRTIAPEVDRTLLTGVIAAFDFYIKILEADLATAQRLIDDR